MLANTRSLLLLGLTTLAAPLAAGQYGVYYDEHGSGRKGGGGSDLIGHPLVDGVLLRFHWSELEPRQGSFQFESIEQRIKPWASAGKHVIIGVGLVADRQGFTPDWALRVGPQIKYVRSGKGWDLQQPKMWDPAFMPVIEPLVRALGARFANDPRIDAVLVGGGHLGFITAAPNRGQAEAYLEAGWTPEGWTDYNLRLIKLYREAFRDKPLLVRGSDLILRTGGRGSRGGANGHSAQYKDVRDKILLEAAARYNASIGFNGLEADAGGFMKTGIPALLSELAPGALAGKYQLEVSDDWPIWAPPDERRNVNAGKDNAYFKTCLENAIGGVRGIPKTNVSFIKMLADDLQCTDPRSKNYQPDCAEKLKWFKAQLVKPRSTGRAGNAP